MHFAELNFPVVQNQIPSNKHPPRCDAFVVTRKLNHPELIFSQDPTRDSFFEQNESEEWQVSLTGDCYVCDKHKYTMIFFNQDGAQNDLTEITDERSRLEIQRSMGMCNFSNDGAPVICGSVVPDSLQGGEKQHYNFRRKLKMLRGDLFALLSVSMSMEFVSK